METIRHNYPYSPSPVVHIIFRCLASPVILQFRPQTEHGSDETLNTASLLPKFFRAIGQATVAISGTAAPTTMALA
jgi:hypothetical protein